jgi:hypothetical protein
MLERAAAAVLSRRYERASSSGSGIYSASATRGGARETVCARVRAGEGLLHPLGMGGPSTMAGLRTFSYRPKTLYRASAAALPLTAKLNKPSRERPSAMPSRDDTRHSMHCPGIGRSAVRILSGGRRRDAATPAPHP